MTGFIQLLCHAWGDYIFQTDRMANMKTKSWTWATLHALAYSWPFIFAGWLGLLRMSPLAWVVIVGTHAVIDRLRLARYVVAFKNWLTEPLTWKRRTYRNGLVLVHPAMGPFATNTGYPEQTPAWMAVWLLIIADNILHITINFAALRWLG